MAAVHGGCSRFTCRASLHTQALAIDGRRLFVGSYNLDPRSRFLNCEEGIMARSGALTGQLEAIFREQTSGSHAWQVRLRPEGGLEWSDGESIRHREPNASPSRTLQAWLARFLPVEAQL